MDSSDSFGKRYGETILFLASTLQVQVVDVTALHHIFSFGRYVWFWQGQHGNVPGTETGDDADADVKPPATGLEVGCCGYRMCSRCGDYGFIRFF